MARPLEFKQRVRLADGAIFDRAPGPRANPVYLGGALWIAVVALGYAGLQRWLSDGLSFSEASEVMQPAYIPEPTAAPASAPVVAHVEPAPAPRPAALPAPISSAEPAALPHTSGPERVASSAPPASSASSASSASAQRAASASLEARRSAREAARTERTPSLLAGPAPESRPSPSVTGSLPSEPTREALTWAEPPAASPTASADAPGSAPVEATPTGTSCEAALARYNEEIHLDGRTSTPDISRSAYAALLERGSYFAHCGVPASTRIDLCVAVQSGRAVGITVVVKPASSSLERCIRTAVRKVRFPYHPKLDVTRTYFAPR